jgi:hypothetical protein
VVVFLIWVRPSVQSLATHTQNDEWDIQGINQCLLGLRSCLPSCFQR